MEIGTTLLEYGADTNAVTRQGISPIHLAAQEGSVDLVSLLLAKNANVNMCNKVAIMAKISNYCLHMYIASCFLREIVCLPMSLSLCVCVSLPHIQSGLTPLHLAAQEDKVNVAEVLLNHGADVNPQTKVECTHTL